jgi:hypothetical protein
MAEAALREDVYIYSSPMPESVTQTYAVPQAQPHAIPRPAHRPRLSAFAVLGFLFVAFLTVMCVYSHIELARISAEVTGIKAVPPRIKAQTGIIEKLNAQIAENNALHLEYERTFNLKEIEVYATQVLGMVKAQTSAEGADGILKPDRAVIPASAKSSGGIKGFFETVTEYFS